MPGYKRECAFEIAPSGDAPMFAGSIDLGMSNFELIIFPLKGTTIPGRWDKDTDLLNVCYLHSGRFCICRPGDHPSRYEENLGLGQADADALAKWIDDKFGQE
jgi:hypothetical protein